MLVKFQLIKQTKSPAGHPRTGVPGGSSLSTDNVQPKVPFIKPFCFFEKNKIPLNKPPDTCP